MSAASYAVMKGPVEPPIVAITPRAPSPADVAVDANDLASSVLVIANVLQATLDMDGLFERLDAAIRPISQHQYLLYDHPREGVRVQIGARQHYSVSYDIVLHEENLGTVTLGRAEAFRETQLSDLEALLCALVYPLRNALLYRRALETAFKDPVTGVNNRAAFDQTLVREADLAQRHGTPLSLIMLDADHFKRINDRYGHVFGDTVLRALGELITSCTRVSDTVFRYGGEEFTILLRNTDLPGASILARRICEVVQSSPLMHEGIAVRLTVSIGVAERQAHEPGKVFVERADAALYRAKGEGRNRVVEA